MNFLLSLLFLACVWDEDTVEDELRGVPTVEVLITNRWFRHGEMLYRLRIATLSKEADLSFEQLDSLAMAYERVGEREQALEVLERKAKALKSAPDEEHQYRYHANKGTIYAHMGKFDDALPELETAVSINPDAHFGREKYQILAIRYIRDATANPELWTQHNFLSYAGYEFSSREHDGVISFSEKAKGPLQLDPEEAQEAIAGMIRFGGREGAELYRTLGDVVAYQGHKTLAWWLYKHALKKGHSAQEELTAAIGAVKQNWEAAGFTDLPTQADFDAVYENGQAWLKTLHTLEQQYNRSGTFTTHSDLIESLVEQANETVPREDLVTSKPVKLHRPNPIANAILFTIVCGVLFFFFVGRFVFKVSRWK